jgi:hypothetical protein
LLDLLGQLEYLASQVDEIATIGLVLEHERSRAEIARTARLVLAIEVTKRFQYHVFRVLTQRHARHELGCQLDIYFVIVACCVFFATTWQRALLQNGIEELLAFFFRGKEDQKTALDDLFAYAFHHSQRLSIASFFLFHVDYIA